MKILTVPEMIAVEQAADAAGHSYAAMMEHAGRGLADAVEREYGSTTGRRLLALVGKGNNGGDALVALAALAGRGWTGSFILAGRDDDNLVRRAETAGWGRIAWPLPEQRDLGRLLRDHDLLLDGLLGTGIRLPLRPPSIDLLRAVRREFKQHLRIVAVDTPSGIDCDTGEAADETLPAHLTVTMAAAKTGFYQFPAAGLLGRIVCAGIGLPAGLPDWDAIRREELDAAMVRPWLPDRPPDSHKGTYGTAWIAAGSSRFPGAALLAARSAFRSGAGLVSSAPPESVYRLLAGQFPESVWLPLPELDGAHSAEGAVVLSENLGRATALLFGPGFGLADSTADFVERLLGSQELPPLVVDADGLKLLVRLDRWPARLPAGSILTPHPGEMSILTGLDRRAIQADRIRVAERFAADWGHVVVLKGANTVIAAPAGRSVVLPVSTPALARAGTGDVLAGLVVGLRAQGVPAFEAAAGAAMIHARAGLRAEQSAGDAAAVIPSDVIAAIGPVLAELRRS